MNFAIPRRKAISDVTIGFEPAIGAAAYAANATGGVKLDATP